MNPIRKLLVLGLVALAVLAAVGVKTMQKAPAAAAGRDVPRVSLAPPEEEPVPPSYDPSTPGVPRLASLGAGACIPCKAMAPIRAELRREYEGSLAVDFYDVWKDREAARHFRIRAIPTLVFYDATGAERARLEGFVTKEAILSTFRDLGIRLRPAAES